MRLGDRVHAQFGSGAPDGREGVIVRSVETDEYDVDYPRDHWSSLGAGALILFDDFGLVHYAQADEDIRLVARAATHGTD